LIKREGSLPLESRNSKSLSVSTGCPAGVRSGRYLRSSGSSVAGNLGILLARAMKSLSRASRAAMAR